MNLEDLVITVDKEVSRAKPKRRRGVNLDDPRVKQLQALELEDSFFLEGKTRKDARVLIDLGKKIGVFLIVREVELDEIYQTAGVRFWRVKEEEMPRYKPKPGEVSSQSEPDDDEELGPNGRPICKEVTYWHHAESSCVGVCQPGEEWVGDLVEPIDHATYLQLKDEYDDDL